MPRGLSSGWSWIPLRWHALLTAMMPVSQLKVPHTQRCSIYITHWPLFSYGNLSHFSYFRLTLRSLQGSVEVYCGWFYYFCDFSGFYRLALQSWGRKVTKVSCQFHQRHSVSAWFITGDIYFIIWLDCYLSTFSTGKIAFPLLLQYVIVWKEVTVYHS